MKTIFIHFEKLFLIKIRNIMEIREKILHFIKNENIKREEIARKAKIAESTLSNYFNGNREIPLSFLIWLLSEYKIIDPRKLFDSKENDIRFLGNNLVAEDREEFINKKDELLNKVSKILDDFFISATNSTHKKNK